VGGGGISAYRGCAYNCRSAADITILQNVGIERLLTRAWIQFPWRLTAWRTPGEAFRASHEARSRAAHWHLANPGTRPTTPSANPREALRPTTSGALPPQTRHEGVPTPSADPPPPVAL